MKANTIKKAGADLEVGDAIRFDAGRPDSPFWRITHFKQAPTIKDSDGRPHGARVACSGDGLELVVFDDDDYEKLVRWEST